MAGKQEGIKGCVFEISINMNLAIFDIDGTLTDTTRIDDVCYQKVLESGFGIIDIHLGLGRSDPDNYTDAGYTKAIFQARLGRLPNDTEIFHIKKHFKELLQQSFASDPGSIREIPGAGVIIDTMRNGSDWKPAIATGGWHDWAEFKLQCTKLLYPDIPLATSDDAPTRSGIVQLAIARAKQQYNVQKFDRIVAIGDNVWDMRTAQKLELPFIGVGRAESLKREGVTVIVENYLDRERFMELLEETKV
jgi:phosphoglycolate phosphatase-like HAD superfamily hydrolase